MQITRNNKKIDVDLKITGATIPSVQEVTPYSLDVRAIPANYWWLKSDDFRNVPVACCDREGYVDYIENNDFLSDIWNVRPVLTFENSNMQKGDRFVFGCYEFAVYTEGRAICCTDIGASQYTDDYTRSDAMDYESSDIKKFVDKWYDLATSGKPLALKIYIVSENDTKKDIGLQFKDIVEAGEWYTNGFYIDEFGFEWSYVREVIADE